MVLLTGDGTEGEFLEQNDDAAHYLLRKVSGAEAEKLVDHREKPLYPPIAVAAHVAGLVTVGVLLSSSATIERVDPPSGPAMLRGASSDAAHKWIFKPLLVGSRQVPYYMHVGFAYSTMGPGSTSTIDMKP